MCKDTPNNPKSQEKMLFPLPETVSDKKIRVDFNAPDISSNGGLMLLGNMRGTLAWKIGRLIPDLRRQEFTRHTYMEMVSQRVGQILCGYEDANDCDQLRGDSVMKMSVGRKPSDAGLASQPTMTRLENSVGMKTLCKIGKLFVDDYMASFDKAPKKVIIDAEGTNVRFVVTGSRNNSAETVYRRYCGRGKMELWIKDMKYFKADRMSCNAYRANYFRLFLYAAAYVMAHRMNTGILER